jgi:AcrR family transcriptional regulator
MNEHEHVESRVRMRTRRALLDAAVRVLSRNRAAPLAEIAEAAGTTRSTLHRYFPDREALEAALGEHANETITEATRAARLEDGPARAALQRLGEAYFDLGDLLLLVHAETDIENAEAAEADDTDRAVHALVERGHADGSIDSALSPRWVAHLIWGVLYSGWYFQRGGSVTRREALDLCLHTLDNAVRPRP